MKNIHVLPTDKPSRTYKIDSIGKLDWSEGYLHQVDGATNQNIYITSDEYIGLSYYLDGSLVRKGVVDDKDYWEVRKDYKKIILTTDQDLIKDGVQAIDDEFLEWFVKNPSCESVKTERLEDGKYVDYLPDGTTFEGVYENYKIIIPKEESKQETFVNEKCFKCGRSQYSSRKPFCLDDFCNKDFYQKPKQETIEEVAPMVELVVFLDRIKKNLTNKTEVLTIQLIIDTIKSEFVDKELKWQQERSYSEEDLKEAYNAESDGWVGFDFWFEQFKKK